MTRSASAQFRCARCGHVYQAPVYSFIDASGEPELQAEVLSGELFLRECPQCGHRELTGAPLVYKDENCLICLSDRPLSVEGLDGVSGRLVSNVGDLIEKVKIFHAGLDDAALEFCKFVTRSEMGKEVQLKFLRTEGVDNEIIFTYPEEGQMQLLAVGFNVYEDCSAIIGRNPVIGESLHGLVKVDSAWVEQFIR